MTGKKMTTVLLPNVAVQHAVEELKITREDIPTQGPPLAVLSDRLTFLAQHVGKRGWSSSKCLSSQADFNSVDVPEAVAVAAGAAAAH